ncbi:MAG: hypothetical protein V4472_21970 [Pseudomonadota bacterium]
MAQNDTLGHTAMVAGEVLMPGASNLIAGNIGAGVATFLGTGLAVAILAPSMPLVAALTAIGLRWNSYKMATTGGNLLSEVAEHIPQSPPKASTPKTSG